jgi:glycosyltransferase involved in cell wall biosynthesis
VKLALEIWSPFPPLPSGIADYVEEQLDVLGRAFDLTLVAEDPDRVDAAVRGGRLVVAPQRSDRSRLRLYHVGNSPHHGFIYREALKTPGVVVLHEWNLHELLLGFAVAKNDFAEYRRQMRREHGERGAIAAEAVASALGGRHWTSVFPLNAEILERALGAVCLSKSTAARVAARVPGTPLLALPHHALLRSNVATRTEARARLGLSPGRPIVLAPGLGTASKSLDVARDAVASIRSRLPDVLLLTVGGGSAPDQVRDREQERNMGRVDLRTLGDALLAADVILALRFPSRGETSGVLMRALAAGRAAIVSAGSTADEDLPEGVVARVNPGPSEASELSAVLAFLLTDESARLRMEGLARETAGACSVDALTERLAVFVRGISEGRAGLEEGLRERTARGLAVRGRIRDELEAVASSLGLAHLPTNVFERLAGL